MEQQDLIEYIKRNEQLGYDEATLRGFLSRNGYSKEAIDEAFGAVSQETLQQNSSTPSLGEVGGEVKQQQQTSTQSQGPTPQSSSNQGQVPNQPDPKIVEYIRQLQRSGYNKEYITAYLEKYGYSPSQIEPAVNAVFTTHHSIHFSVMAAIGIIAVLAVASGLFVFFMPDSVGPYDVDIDRFGDFVDRNEPRVEQPSDTQVFRAQSSSEDKSESRQGDSNEDDDLSLRGASGRGDANGGDGDDGSEKADEGSDRTNEGRRSDNSGGEGSDNGISDSGGTSREEDGSRVSLVEDERETEEEREQGSPRVTDSSLLAGITEVTSVPRAQDICSQISDTGGRDQCYTTASQNLGVVSFCNDILDSASRDSCLMFFVLQGEYGLCTQLGDFELKQSCFDFRNQQQDQQQSQQQTTST